MRKTLASNTVADVPCGSCIGCCTSSYFIHLHPEDSGARRRIPRKLLFRAPGMPKGHLLMGFDDQGRCPMLAEGRCSIYEDRPTTCRTYDCRVFAAAGIAAGEDDKTVINGQVARWDFDHPAALDRAQHEAVQAAARFLSDHADSFPNRAVPTNPSQLAILALKVYDVFLGRPDRAGGRTRNAADNARIAQAVIASSRRFEARRDGGQAPSSTSGNPAGPAGRGESRARRASRAASG